MSLDLAPIKAVSHRHSPWLPDGRQAVASLASIAVADISVGKERNLRENKKPKRMFWVVTIKFSTTQIILLGFIKFLQVMLVASWSQELQRGCNNCKEGRNNR